MKTNPYQKLILLTLLLCSTSAKAGVYLQLSAAQMAVDTPAASTYPMLADVRLGYAIEGHQIELAAMTSYDDDSLNQLTVKAPLSSSILYHYIPRINSSLKLHLIIGASQVNIESSYPGTAGTDDNFSGISAGIGLQEAFKSIPQLKVSLQWIQLYRGRDLHISNTSLGIHYAF